MIIAALIAGNLCAWNLSLRAADTNTPPAGAPTMGQRPPGLRSGPGIELLAKQLSLTDDQKTKIKPVLESHDQKIRDVRTDTTLSPTDRRAKMLAIRQDVTTQLKAILTPEQFDKYQKMTPMGRAPRTGPALGGTNVPPAAPKNLTSQ